MAGIADDKKEFSVILVSVGERRAEVFAALRVIAGLNREVLNDLLDGTPKPIKEGITKAKAEEIKKRLEEAGATVQIKHGNWVGFDSSLLATRWRGAAP